jgi:hypothetical protein
MTEPRRMRTRPEWWLQLVPAAVTLATVKVLLGLRGHRRTVALLRRTSPDGVPAGVAGAPVPVPVTVLASCVATVTGRSRGRGDCLARSLTLWWLARRRGYELELVMGVGAPQAGVLPAHAWIEYGGTPVNDTMSVRERYSVLPFPAERAD